MADMDQSFVSSLVSVTGISMGDEGKGRVVHEILEHEKKSLGRPAAGVMKVNGGANAGHTAAGLKLNLLPSGVGDPEVETLLIGSGVVADPRKFLWEAMPLEARGLEVINRLLIDQRCQVSDLSHRLLDLAWENYRVNQLGMESRGSTGRGISPAYGDETGQWQIFYQSFLGNKNSFAQALRERCQRALDTIQWVCKVKEEDWHGFFKTLTSAETRANQASLDEEIFSVDEFDFQRFKGNKPFSLNLDELIEVYWEAGNRLKACVGDGRDFLLGAAQEKRLVVAEFGQAYWLDKRHGFTPNVTASHTTSSELFHSGGIPVQPINQVGCCKAYDTKVGTHHFLTQMDHLSDPWGQKLAKLEFGTSTGRQRMVGWFDAVEKGNALRYGGFDQIVINKLDALTLDSSVPSELKICTAYQLADGQLTRAVPRDENSRKSLKPVYKTIAGWNENLKGMKSFEQLPAQAKEYISEMLAAIIEVAYPNGWSDIALPKIRFIGIGPDPGEIISDLPTTRQLLESVSSEPLPVAS
ncbi:adenylosuccinate synthetase [Opitutales bacterium]|nr:adenylosuccinate synthetase [Opitutales bacterium]